MKKADRITLYYLDDRQKQRVLDRLADLVIKTKEMPGKEGRKLVYIFVKPVD